MSFAPPSQQPTTQSGLAHSGSPTASYIPSQPYPVQSQPHPSTARDFTQSIYSLDEEQLQAISARYTDSEDMHQPPRLAVSLDDVPEEDSGGGPTSQRGFPGVSAGESAGGSGSTTPMLPGQSRPRKTPSVRTLGRPSNDHLQPTVQPGPSSGQGHAVRRTVSTSSTTTLGAGGHHGKISRGPSGLGPHAHHGPLAVNGNRYRTTPRLPHDKEAKEVPATGMYWSKAPVWGSLPARSLRAHTVTLVDGTGWVIGGSEDKDTSRDVYCFDTETFQWSHPTTTGTPPPPCRAHTATLIDRTKIIIYGGGLGGNYFDGIYMLDTNTRRWYTPPVHDGPKPKGRRAHTAVLYNGKIYVFGGGNGLEALNDVWCLDVGVGGAGVPGNGSDPGTPTSHHYPHLTDSRRSGNGNKGSNGSHDAPDTKMAFRWEEVQTTGRKPGPRGYHSATLVGHTMVVVGGSDGKECFTDIWMLSLEDFNWTMIKPQAPGPQYKRLSHSATQVGSYLYIIAGHNGAEYCSEVLLFNLVSLHFEPRVIYGKPPSIRGNHAAMLADSRVFLIGGFNGQHGFEDVHILDLGASAYLPQVTHFEVDYQTPLPSSA